MKIHLQRWGVIYVLLAAFLGTWVAHYMSMPEGESFWNATFENWQSEFLQLFWQALAVEGWRRFWFDKMNDDSDEINVKLDEILRRTRGVDA